MELRSDSCNNNNNNNGCIVHTVTKFDTLAGVAIRYGVEVADVKRMNGLTTDLQMFALNSLQIPLSVGTNHSNPNPNPNPNPKPQRETSSSSPPSHKYKYSSPQRNISSSITCLREYYGLPLTDQTHSKSKTEANGFSNIYKTIKGPPASDQTIEKLIRRRKSELDLNNRTPEDFAHHTPNMLPLASKDSSVAQAVSGVRKSSSAPTFLPSQIDTNTPSSSIWPISLFNDLQAISIASPLFDGLPKPTSGRKNKPARD